MTDAKHVESSQLPSDTTPTWEMELLVSGATTIGLLQLPGLLDKAYFSILNRSSEDVADLLQFLWLYSKISLITLIVTFVLHLCLRGYWVALVGMNSVYPGGVRWQNLRMGPIARHVSERDAPTMQHAIELADNRATRVFGTGFGFAMLMLMPVLLVLIGLLCSLLVGAVSGVIQAVWTFAVVLALITVPWSLAMIADRHLGVRLAADGPLARTLGKLFGFYNRLGLDRRNNFLIALFLSHEGRLRTLLTALLILLPVGAIVLVPTLVAKGRIPLGEVVGLPAAGTFSQDSSPAAFYSSLGVDRATAAPLPYIPSRIAHEGYLELFVPFLGPKHTEAMRIACPGSTVQSDAVRQRAALECLARLSAIQVDSVPVAVRFDSSSDPQTGQRGMLAMIPVQGLAQGRHELSLNEPGRAMADTRRPARRYRIPFWK